jgi:hypothetical protein
MKLKIDNRLAIDWIIAILHAATRERVNAKDYKDATHMCDYSIPQPYPYKSQCSICHDIDDRPDYYWHN